MANKTVLELATISGVVGADLIPVYDTAEAGSEKLKNVTISELKSDFVDSLDSKIDTTSGTLQTAIDDKSDTDHTHDSATTGDILINGGLDVWQRGDTFTVSGTGMYWADRWYYGGDNNDFTDPSSTIEKVDFTPGQTEVTGDPTHYAKISLENLPDSGDLTNSIGGSSSESGYVSYAGNRLFDDSTSSYWRELDAATEHWVQWSFPTAQVVNFYRFLPYNNASYYARAFKLQASTSSTFSHPTFIHDLEDGNEFASNPGAVWLEYDLDNTTAYRYYRIYFYNHPASTYLYASELELILKPTFDNRHVSQKIENVVDYSGREITFSYWAKADTSRDITASVVQNFGEGGSTAVVASDTAETLTASWTQYSYTTTLATTSGTTIGVDNNTEVKIVLPEDDSSEVYLANFKFELGDTATALTATTAAAEVERCKPYYQKTYPLEVTPGTIPGVDTYETNEVEITSSMIQPVASSEYSVTYPSENAIDGNFSTYWLSETSAGPHSLRVRFTTARIITRVRIYLENSAWADEFYLEGSTSSTTGYTTLHTFNSTARTDGWYEFDVAAYTTPYNYFRFVSSDLYSIRWGIKEIEMFEDLTTVDYTTYSFEGIETYKMTNSNDFTWDRYLFPVEMRTTPEITIYNARSGVENSVTKASVGFTLSGDTLKDDDGVITDNTGFGTATSGTVTEVYLPTTEGFRGLEFGSTMSTGQILNYQYTADAEIY